MKSLFQRIYSLYLVIYCGLILPPTGVLALLEYCGVCDPNPVPWLRKAALLGAIPLVVYAIISAYRREKHATRKELL